MKYVTEGNLCQETFDNEFLFSLFYSFMTKIPGTRQRKEHGTHTYLPFLMADKHF